MTPEKKAEARAMIEQLLTRPPYAGWGGMRRLAVDLEISQPSLHKIRGGGGVSLETARRVAVLSGLHADTFGEEVLSRFKILEAVVIVYPDRWAAPVIAAARAGAWTNDVPAERWVKRLDELAAAFAKLPP
jgi:hypothetical protein